METAEVLPGSCVISVWRRDGVRPLGVERKRNTTLETEVFLLEKLTE
jgi:hypothetical protein